MTKEHIEELQYLWLEETNEEWTQEWRDELTPEEQILVDTWDGAYEEGIARMIINSKGAHHGN